MSTVEELRKLQKELIQSRILYHVGIVDYESPHVPGTEISPETERRISIGIDLVSSSYPRSVYPRESLTLPLVGLSMVVERFGNYDLSQEFAVVDINLAEKTMRLDIGDQLDNYESRRKNVLNQLERTLKQIAKRLSYKLV